MCKPFKDERAAKADASPVAVQRQVQPERERPHAPGAAGFWRKVGFVLGDSLGDAA